jgi:hypothetical protein
MLCAIKPGLTRLSAPLGPAAKASRRATALAGGWPPAPLSAVTGVGENLGCTGGRQWRREGGERRV